MGLGETSKRLAAVAATMVTLFAVNYLAVRPWYLRWGATEADARRPLPGDEIVPNARTNDSVTRAITVEAPTSDVWSWVGQLGQERGVFYSYEVLEDLVGCRMVNEERVHPEWQHWGPGDKLWMYPPERVGGMGHASLVVHEPGHALGFATRQVGTAATAPYDGSWSFIVESVDARRSKLIARGRAGGARGILGTAFDRFVFEPIHFVMERKMLIGIRERAEGMQVTSEAADIAQVVSWVVLFGVALTSAVRVFRRERWVVQLVTFVAAVGAFELLTLRQPPAWLGAILVLGIVTGPVAARRMLGALAGGGERHASERVSTSR